MKLTRENFTGPWAGLPVAWTDDDRFDEATYRDDIQRCCLAGAAGVYSGGTSGEFYAMEFDEFRQVARATVQQCHAHDRPAMIGCSSTYTRGACLRASLAADLGADAIQVALPFWLEVADEEIVPFFQSVSAAAEGLPLSIYETTRTKRALTLQQHRAIKDALPNYLMVKANAGTLGATAEGCEALSPLVNVFVNEGLWDRLGSCGAQGACSAMVYWNPRVTLDYWEKVQRHDTTEVEKIARRVAALLQFLHERFGSQGFTDTAYDRLGGVACGFLRTSLRSRGPYRSATAEDVATLQAWLGANFAEMLRQ